MATILILPCGNPSCKSPGLQTCSGCHLVKYCSRDCQKAHFKTHKAICKSKLTTPEWLPAWAVQSRNPAFLSNDDKPMTAFGHVQPKYLCGNMPSFDHLKFAGLENRSDVNLLFAASGDLRNIISTVNGTAGSFTVKVVANDREPYIAIRNLMLLLLLGSKSDSSLDNDKEAANRLHVETAIHLWFSAMLRPDMAQTLRQLCAEKLDKIRATAGKPGAAGDTLIGTTVQLSNGCTVRCIFTRNDWKTLFAMLDSANITAAKATTSRHRVTQAPERLDYRDRHLDIIRPAHRNSKVQYWRDGMVLPFSVDRSEYSVPNFTLFDLTTSEWLFMDSFDPLNGWPITVITTPSIEVLSPKNDVYGLLYYYLFDHLANFHKRLTSSENNAVHFTLLSCDAKNISNVPGVVTHSFDLIDVSNITDLGYLGVETTLFTIAKPLLKPDGQLITLFMNYIVDLQLQNSSGWEAEQTKTMLKRVTNFLSPGEMMEHFGPLNMLPYRFMNFMDTLKEHDKAWTGYLRTLELEMTAKHMGMKTVKMEKPYRFDVELNKSLRSRFKEIKAILMDRGLSGISGHEVYVVWAKDQ